MNLVKKGPSGSVQNRTSHKLPADAVELILHMTVRGASNAMVRKALKDRFKLEVHTNLIGYYKRTRAGRLAELYEEELSVAREECELASLAERVAVLAGKIEEEKAKPSGGSSLVIIRAIGAAGSMLFKAEMLRIKMRELAWKEEDDSLHESILREMEMRSRIK
jgi:hypothetical protein